MRADGITDGMRSRKHAQTRPSPVPVALLLIDVLTTFQFPDGDAILKGALAMRDALVELKTRARELDIPVLYVNDNFGEQAAALRLLYDSTGGAATTSRGGDPDPHWTDLQQLHRRNRA
jgi:nicotinamidase-related amidase